MLKQHFWPSPEVADDADADGGGDFEGDEGGDDDDDAALRRRQPRCSHCFAALTTTPP